MADNCGKLSRATSEPLNSLFFVSANIGWAAGGTNNALLLYTTNQGQTWTTIGSGINSGPILDIAFVATADTGWAITADSIYFTTNGGHNWATENYAGVTGTAVNKAIALLNSHAVFVGGRRFQTGIQDSSPEVYNRKQSGNTFVWGPTSTNQFANMDRIESIAFTNNLIGVAGGIQGKLYRMNPALPDITGPWDVILDLGGGNNQTITGIDFVNDYKAMFGTPHQMGANSYTLIYHSQDTGVTWPIVDSINNFNMNSLAYPDENYAWAVGNNGKIYKGTSQQFGLAENAEAYVTIFNVENGAGIHLTTGQVPATLNVFTIDGRLLLRQELKEATTTIGLEQNGVYVFVVKLKNGTYVNEKIVKFSH